MFCVPLKYLAVWYSSDISEFFKILIPSTGKWALQKNVSRTWTAVSDDRLSWIIFHNSNHSLKTIFLAKCFYTWKLSVQLDFVSFHLFQCNFFTHLWSLSKPSPNSALRERVLLRRLLDPLSKLQDVSQGPVIHFQNLSTKPLLIWSCSSMRIRCSRICL